MTAKEDFEKLYNSYYRAVESYFIKRVPPDDAEDLAQQTFMKLWAYISGSHYIRSYKSLIFTIAKSVLVDFYRRKGSYISLEESAENLSSLYSFDFEDAVIMRSLLATLSSEEKVMLELKAQGFSSGEIGKRLGISASAVRSRLQNIRKKLNSGM